jgi:hypothetical protein
VALLSEKKTILVVCDNAYDLIPIVQSMFDLIYPFEWCLPQIPFLLVKDANDTDDQMFEMINNI